MLLFVAGAILLSFLFHRIDMTRKTKRSINKTIFGGVFIISIVLILTGLVLGAWTGLMISAIGVYLFIPSIFALVTNQILKRSSKKKT